MILNNIEIDKWIQGEADHAHMLQLDTLQRPFKWYLAYPELYKEFIIPGSKFYHWGMPWKRWHHAGYTYDEIKGYCVVRNGIVVAAIQRPIDWLY